MKFEELYDIAKLNNIKHICISGLDYFEILKDRNNYKIFYPMTELAMLKLGFAGAIKEEIILYLSKYISKNHYKMPIVDQPLSNDDIYWSSEIEFEKGK